MKDKIFSFLYMFKRKMTNARKEYPLIRLKTKSSLNPDKCFYVIRRIGDSGFFSNVLYVISHLCYCDKKGYIPIIDMENYPTLYNEEEEILGTKNAWEYFFYQPGHIKLQEAYASKHVYLSDNLYLRTYVPMYTGKYASKPSWNDIQRLHMIIRKYIEIKPDLLNEFDAYWQKLCTKNEKVLGVHIRGTDMNEFGDHPKPVKLEEFIESIRKLEEITPFHKIFLCTDEKSIAKKMKSVFMNRIIMTEAYRAEEKTKEGIHFSNDFRKHHKYLLGKEVLRDAILLSKCDSIIYGNSNVPFFALIYNGGKYENSIHLDALNER